MNITEFLKGRNVERQAVTRYIGRHEEIFEGHVKKNGKALELDEDAVEELEKVYPLAKPVTIINGVDHEEYIRVQNELIMSQQTIGELQNRLIDAQEQISMAKATELLLEDKKEQIETLREMSDAKDQEIRNLREALEEEKNKTWLQKLFKK